MGRRTLLAVLAFWLACSLLGQTAEVTHNVNLRRDPSTSQPPIRLLTPREQVILLSPPKTSGYYHVKTNDGKKGWVWDPNVQVITSSPTPTPAAIPTASPTRTPTGGGVGMPTPSPTPTGPSVTPAAAIDSAWHKDAPIEETFHTTSGTCPPNGDTSKDPETNILKNRVDDPTSVHEVTWAAIASLPIPHVKTTRKAWRAADRALAASQVVPYEGVALTVVGYIVTDVKNENSGGGTNCNFTLDPEVDWHIPLVEHAHDPEKLALVVETTPRVRKSHPKWTRAALATWINSDAPIRVTGFLLFDEDHPSMLYDPSHPNAAHKYRKTLWEIHPISKIEVWTSGAWKDLNSLP
jgi:hypothetical protein